MKMINKPQKKFFTNFFFVKNFRGVSIVVGYVLLVVLVIIMSSVVHQWMKTYVPRDIMNCPDDVSIFIKNINFNCTNHVLNLTLQNNGRFNIDGYFIRATNEPDQTLAIVDLSGFFDKDQGSNGIKAGNSIIFNFFGENSFKPDSEPVINIFKLEEMIYSIEIIPLRYQIEGNKERVVSCGNSRVREKIICS
jgi:hypothetical protein